MEPEKIQFSHYRALKLLGKGNVGEVYLADDAQAKRQVAAKIIRIEALQADREININTLRQFLREVAASAGLNHPNILPLGDHGEATLAGSPGAYVTMPYRSEGSLSTWLSQHAQKQPSWRPTPRQVIHIVRQVGSALQHAHEHKIMHLDVKPTNILLHNRSAIDEYPDLLLSDFGTAVLLSAPLKSGQQTNKASAYVAPEQLANQPGFASDQYALAAITYELLTGTPPFQGTSAQEQLKPARDFIPQLPPEADLALQRALARKPEERFPSVAAFTQAFQTALQSMAGTPTKDERSPTPTPQPPTPPRQGDIHATLSISHQEAREGTVRTLNLPNGEKVDVQIPAGARAEQIIILNGKGDVPAPGARPGDLYLRLSLPRIPAVTPPAAQKGGAASPARNGAPAQSPAPLTPPPATPRPNGPQGPASIAPMPPSPAPGPRSQGPASVAPMPPSPAAPPRSQGPASIAPMPPTPGATPRPNMAQGPASIAPMPPTTPRPMSQGPASIAPMSPTPPGTPRPMSQGPASLAPLPPTPNGFARQNQNTPSRPPASTQSRRANSPSAVIIMIVLLLLALGIGVYGAVTSNWALVQNIVFGQTPPTASTANNTITPTPTSKPAASSIWHAQSSGTTQGLISITWADTRFVTVGIGGTVLTSPNGTTWTAQNSKTFQSLWSVAWSGSLLVAVGTGGTIVTSPDGTTWTTQKSGTTQDLWSIAWVDGTIFVAVGSGGVILTSRDGHTWASQKANAGQILDGVAWSGSLLVVVGAGGTIISSSDDATTWSVENSGTQQLLQSVAWVNNQFIAVGTNGTILTSAKGTTWTPQNSNVTQNLANAGVSGTLAVVIGDNGLILASSNGKNWNVQPSGTARRLLSIARSTTTFAATVTTPIPATPISVIVGDNGTVLTGP